MSKWTWASDDTPDEQAMLRIRALLHEHDITYRYHDVTSHKNDVRRP